MKNMMIALTLILASTATVAMAQDGQDSASTSQMATYGKQTAMQPAKDRKLRGSLAFTGVFTRQWTVDQPGVNDRLLAGWGVMPEINFTKRLGLQADFVSSYTSGVYPVENKLSMMAGPRYTLNPRWRGTPFVFGEAGETRTGIGRNMFGTQTHPGIDWNPTASAGVGFDLNLTPRFGLEFVPAEWTGERFDYNGQWQNNYQARFGFVFNLR
jgi:opacity protein-like surface antigen